MKRALSVLLASLTALGLAAGTASAQCLGPDGLEGPCWEPTQATLPAFPDLVLPGAGICYQNCVPQPKTPTRLVVNAPQFVACGKYAAPISVIDGTTGSALMAGTLTLDYTRTWDEVSGLTPPERYQVFRMVAKVDMGIASPVLPSGCPVPPCLSVHQRVFYYGYVDYAYNCSTGSWTGALVLFHNCDEFIHDSGLSATPGASHPGVSYAFVGPDTLANSFSPGLITPPEGVAVAEALRNVPTMPGGTCINEDRIASGDVRNLAQACGCSFALNPKQLTARRLRGSGTCTDPVTGPSTFSSVKTTPAFPWFHDMTTSIGRWTTGASYPGPEEVWVDEVPIVFRDSCYAVNGQPDRWGEIYYGATTRRGFSINAPAGSFLTDKFVDLAANASFALPGPVALPMVGVVMPTRNLIYLNLP